MQVQNLQIGRFMSMLANYFSGKNQTFEAFDFAIGFEKEVKKKQTADHIAESLKAAFKGNVVTRENKRKGKKS